MLTLEKKEYISKKAFTVNGKRQKAVRGEGARELAGIVTLGLKAVETREERRNYLSKKKRIKRQSCSPIRTDCCILASFA